MPPKTRHHPLLPLALLAVTPLTARAAPSWTATVIDSTNAYASLIPTLIAEAQIAGATWSNYMVNPQGAIDIEIDIHSVPSGRGDGASTTSSFVRTVNSINIFEQGAAAELRTGLDPNGASPDIRIQIDPAYINQYLWFDPNPAARTATVPADRIDAMSFFLHELGHALAFTGWRDWSTTQLPGNYQSTFDAYVTSSVDTPFFTGPAAQSLYGGPVPLTTGNLFHVGNNSPRPGQSLIPDLMNGVVFYLGTRYTISPLDLAILTDAGLPVPETATWKSAAASWSDPAQWSSTPRVPSNGSPAGALYNAAIAAGVVTLDVNTSIYSLTLSGGTLTGTCNLTLVNAAITGAYNLTGTTTVSGVISFSGVQHKAGPFAGTGTLTVAAGTALLADGIRLPALLLDGTAILRPTPTTAGTTKLSSLTLAGTTDNWTGHLELNNNALILDVPATASKSAVLSTLQNQLSHTAGNSAGITSSTTLADPAHKTTVLIDNALFGATIFYSQQVDATSLLVLSTFYGDANLDRKVNVTDLGTLATYYGQNTGPFGPLHGDFNNDGIVNVTDLGFLATNYGAGTSGQPYALESDPSYFSVPGSSFPSPVPEPASLLLIVPPLLLKPKRSTPSRHQESII